MNKKEMRTLIKKQRHQIQQLKHNNGCRQRIIQQLLDNMDETNTVVRIPAPFVIVMRGWAGDDN